MALSATPTVGSLYTIGNATYNYKTNTLGNTYGVYDIVSLSAKPAKVTVKVTVAPYDKLSPKSTAYVSSVIGNANLTGTQYNDYLVTVNGNDSLYGKEGNDWLVAGNGNNTIIGGEGDDTIVTRTGNYVSSITDSIIPTLLPYYNPSKAVSVKKQGAFSGDIIYDGTGNDFVDTGIGDDQVYMGSGNNQLLLGAGNDQVYLDLGNYDTSTAATLLARKLEKIKIRLEDGNDVVNLGITNVVAGSSSADSKTQYFDNLNKGIDFGTINYSQTSAGRYLYDYAYKSKISLYAGSGSDLIMTGAGDDILDLSTGNDSVHSGAGKDYIDAGSGDDVVVTGAGADSVFLAQGADIVYASFGDIISFTAKDKQKDVIKIDPLLLTYEEGIIVKSKYEVVVDATTGKTSLSLVPLERLGKIVVNYPEVGYDKIDLSELFTLNKINVVDISKPTSGTDLTMSVLSAVDASKYASTYIHYDHNFVLLQDLNSNVKLVSATATSVFDLTKLSDVRLLMSRVPDTENLIQNKAKEYAFINVPIEHGSTVDVIEVHLIGVTSAQAHDMLVVA